MKSKLFLLAAVILISCGPTSKLRRAERLIEKAEKQGAAWHVDTVWQTVEIPVPSVRTDSIFTSLPGDTVVISKDRLTVKYVRLKGDSVFIEGECKSDTVIKEVPTIVTKTIKAPPSKFKWWHLVIALLAGAGVVAIFKR